MTSVHRFTSENSDKLFHLPSLGVKHFPFNVVLFSYVELTFAKLHNANTAACDLLKCGMWVVTTAVH